MKRAKLYKRLTNDKVLCLACSWYCKIDIDKVGICATRLNKEGVLYSLVYGKAMGLHLDPVEKKPLYHFLPSSKIFSFGTVGCNFGCLFCQNWDMSQINKSQITNPEPSCRGGRSQIHENMLINLIDDMSVTISPKEIVRRAKETGAKGIAYTYNEPAIFVEFTHDTAILAKKEGLKNIYVSNGFESDETFKYIRDYIDAINIDLKSFSKDYYIKVCKAKIEPVLNNIKKFFQIGVETEVTTLIVPGLNDSKKELKSIAEFLVSVSSDIPWHVSAFYPTYKMTDIFPTPHSTLVNAYNIGKKAGLKYIYIGNIRDTVRSSTFCPKCGQCLIKRDGYDVKIDMDLGKGKCSKCAEKIYGVWK